MDYLVFGVEQDDAAGLNYSNGAGTSSPTH